MTPLCPGNTLISLWMVKGYRSAPRRLYNARKEIRVWLPLLRLAWLARSETVRSQQIDTIGWCYVEVDVLEMQEDGEEKRRFHMPFLGDRQGNRFKFKVDGMQYVNPAVDPGTEGRH